MMMKGWSAAALVVLVGCKVQSTGSFMGPATSTTPRSQPSGESRNLTVPDVTFMTRAQAEAAIARAGFASPPSIDDGSLCGSTVDKKIVELGHVCYQHPPAGRQQGARIPIRIRVQTENPYGGDLGGGRRWFLLPDFVGVHIDQAKARIKELGFTAKEVKITYSDDPSCKPNIVCKTIPEGLSRTDTTSDKLFYVGRPPEPPKPAPPSTTPTTTTPAAPTTTPATPSMGDAF